MTKFRVNLWKALEEDEEEDLVTINWEINENFANKSVEKAA